MIYKDGGSNHLRGTMLKPNPIKGPHCRISPVHFPSINHIHSTSITSSDLKPLIWKSTVLTLHYTRQSPVVLELVERLLQHVLWIDLLHTQQVEHHVVGQVEGTVQGVCRSLCSTWGNQTDKKLLAFDLQVPRMYGLWINAG